MFRPPPAGCVALERVPRVFAIFTGADSATLAKRFVEGLQIGHAHRAGDGFYGEVRMAKESAGSVHSELLAVGYWSGVQFFAKETSKLVRRDTHLAGDLRNGELG